MRHAAADITTGVTVLLTDAATIAQRYAKNTETVTAILKRTATDAGPADITAMTVTNATDAAQTATTNITAGTVTETVTAKQNAKLSIADKFSEYGVVNRW